MQPYRKEQIFERYKLYACPRKDATGKLMWPLVFNFSMSCDNPEEVSMMLETVLIGKRTNPEFIIKVKELARLAEDFCKGEMKVIPDQELFNVSEQNLERKKYPFFRITIDFWRPQNNKSY